ncbi:MAG: peptide ABC transporter substrate-binding protein [Ardenticatenaceae bacterium]|nr:peptide ABC transporter substrate-binding protein [Ardenticatenaceae bacterium]MCB9443089.1 peptide ABC transporter substrate-binding protein [Ardenticatenaceae bacterium]
MKINLRWQLLLAAMGLGLVLALLSYQVQSASLCTTRVPATGGTFAEGIVGIPQSLNPLLSDSYPVDRELVSLIFDGLTRYDESGQLVPGLAESWTVSEDGLTIQFRLRPGVTWHDGEPFTADDVVFTYRLMQDDAFPGPAALRTLWQSVTVNKLDDLGVEIVLPQPYSPFWAATTRGILPAHQLEGVTAVSLAASSFNQQPVGTGPFMVAPGQNWDETHRLQLTPNPTYWRSGTKINTLEFRFYPDETTLLAAFEAGNIQAMNRVGQTLLPQAAADPDVRLFTAPEPDFTTLLFNLTESGSPALQDIAVRQALAYGLDRVRLVDDVLNGQGLPLEGPYLPSNWAYNPSLLTAYSYQPVTATAMLDAAGWGLPEGGTVRQQGEEAMTVRLLALGDERSQGLAQGVAADWSALGVDVAVETAVSTTELYQKLAAREFDVALVDVVGSDDPDLYDFWSQEAIVRGQNYGGWNNRRASEALENGRETWPTTDRQPFYNTFLRQFNSDLPAITLYQHVYTYALSKNVNDAEIGRIFRPIDRYLTFSDWFLLYRDVTVICQEEDVS